MSLIIKENREYDLLEEGLYHGIVIWIYDLGTQFNPTYDNYSQKMLLAWELPEARMTIEKEGHKLDVPRVISKKYTKSLNEKSILYRDLVSWRGKAFTENEINSFDVSKLIKKNCMLQIIHKQAANGKTYASISNILPLYKATQKEPESQTRIYSIEYMDNIPEGTPQWIEEIIRKSEEFKNQKTVEDDVLHVNDTALDDVPF